MNQAMTENPPGVYPSIPQEQLVQLFAQIGVGPNQELRTQSPSNLLILQRAARDGLALLQKESEQFGNVVNGWVYPPLGMSDLRLVKGAPASIRPPITRW